MVIDAVLRLKIRLINSCWKLNLVRDVKTSRLRFFENNRASLWTDETDFGGASGKKKRENRQEIEGLDFHGRVVWSNIVIMRQTCRLAFDLGASRNRGMLLVQNQFQCKPSTILDRQRRQSSAGLRRVVAVATGHPRPAAWTKSGRD